MTGLPLSLKRPISRSDLLELAQARARHSVEIENDGLDALVVARGTQRVDDVAHERLLQRHSLRSSERALKRVAGQLIDEHAARLDDERGRSRYEDPPAEGADDEQQEQAQQQDQVQQAPQPIEATPDTRHDSQRPRAIVLVHVSFLKKSPTDRAASTTNPARRQ